jgi:hypothetical protein
MLPVITLISWIESVACLDEYVKLKKLSDGVSLLIYGSGYAVNWKLLSVMKSMSVLCFIVAVLNSLCSLLLYCYRHQYCVEYPAQVRARARKLRNVGADSEDETNF